MESSSQIKPRRTAEEVRQEIQRTRQEVVLTAAALQEEVAMRTDWRQWVRRRPVLFMAAAFAVGFLIAGRKQIHLLE